MTPIATSAKPFIDQIPAKDRELIRGVERHGGKVKILWTNEGWRYQVTIK